MQTVQTTISLLQKAIQELQQLPNDMPVNGHIAYPSTGYSGDPDGEITAITFEPTDETETSIYLGVRYK